jgi:GLPGLI family protein
MWYSSFGPKSKSMRKTILAWPLFLLVTSLWGQQKEGTVVYERTMQLQIRINDDNAIEQMLPKTRIDRFELTFGNNQSLWKHVDEEENNDEFGGGGMQIRMVGPGQNDVLFCDFNNARRIEQRELFDKKFVVEDTIRKLNWKLTGESQTFLGHPCQKATAQRITQRMQMTIDNGKMERKEVADTNNIVAWFTNDIPVSAGPEVQGQLPGLILALDINDGRMVYKVLEMSPKVDLASIKEPTKGKKVTPAQFNDERNKMMDEMQKNNQGNGGNRIIIRN